MCTCTHTSVLHFDPPAGPEYGIVGTPDGVFNNYNTLVRSSALDRTIMTARSFLDAVFPPINLPTDTKYLPDGQQVCTGCRMGAFGVRRAGAGRGKHAWGGR